MKRLFVLIALFGCFYGLGSYGLQDTDEGLYGSVARDMLHGSSLIIPHLNGLTYIEKPPLLYWLTAASMGVFGENEWAARLPVALATFLLALCIAAFLKKHADEKTGLIAGIVFVSSPVILVIGRTLYFDMLMTLFLSAALMAFYCWWREQQPKWLLACYAAIGLGVMAKGLLVIVLTGGVALTFMLVERAPLRRIFQVFDLRALSVFLLIAAPWHVLAIMQEKNFAWFYFINEHILRFLDMRVPHDYYHGSIWYYVPRILGYLLPWTFFLPLLWPNKEASTALPENEHSFTRFLWVWFWLAFIFFSVSSAKANYYMIAGTPPLIMLLALRIHTMFGQKRVLRWCVPVLVLLPVAVYTAGIKEQMISEKQAAAYLKEQKKDVAIYVDFEGVSSLAFYLPKPIAIVESESNDLLYGRKHGERPDLFIDPPDWHNKKDALLIVRNIYVPNFHRNFPGQFCVEKEFERVTVMKPCP